ncbi:Asp/Glu/Hydantoin racemase [Parapedobacter composti]|uniref:Asp/Glu/Hydantoin racemase n=1 Tax=Parapedobacter composti TaxID=623281 RepID=A0A1I1GK00_9SPHI|nr:Asp/Glu/hydantoin racemase [Parapedobacter composti]SFC10198.1 Asp/Glu/Hydantoin racemase [Parapedobacter composti]
MKTVTTLLGWIGMCAVLYSCNQTAGDSNRQTGVLSPIEQAIITDTASFYYVDVAAYPAHDESLPIGVFDSGTGGLTVLDALVRYDENNNDNQTAGRDERPDFQKEKFIYLADQANMPYGNYHSEQKSDLLVEHTIKDVQFLLSNRYYPQASSVEPSGRKQPVKAIVIACNTATAYGKAAIDAFMEKAGLNIPVIGVIDAGARGALAAFGKDESGSIGVFATVGTIASKGYEKTLMRIKDELGYTGNIQVYNQGGHGVAEAVDEEPDFIDRRATAPRPNYRGPALDNKSYAIDKDLLDVYRFDFSGNKMLCDSESALDCSIMQLNDTENYVRYYLVSLLEQMRKQPDAKPLKALLLGCTHYPYLTDNIKQVLDELYHFQEAGEYRYRHLMAETVHIIDPAENVADELYTYLKAQQLFNPAGDMTSSEFYISVPNTHNSNVKTDKSGHFTYDYKYGRRAGEIQEYVKVVPFDYSNIPAETIERMKTAIPQTFRLINTLNQ